MRSPGGLGWPGSAGWARRAGECLHLARDNLWAPEPQVLTLQGMSVLGVAVLGMTFSNLSTRKDTGLESRGALWCLWITGRWGGLRHRPGEWGTREAWQSSSYHPRRKKFHSVTTSMARLNIHPGNLHFSEGKWNS